MSSKWLMFNPPLVVILKLQRWWGVGHMAHTDIELSRDLIGLFLSDELVIKVNLEMKPMCTVRTI